jgi:hypothetical protein
MPDRIQGAASERRALVRLIARLHRRADYLYSIGLRRDAELVVERILRLEAKRNLSSPGTASKEEG